MTSLVHRDFLEAARTLHAKKDAMYRNAWKKRGEVLGVLANIARKVDRLENVLDGAPGARDESLLDTAVDLLVYSIKYQTFLADHDVSIAKSLFPRDGLCGPYSEGCAGFEHLLLALRTTGYELDSMTVAEAVSCVLFRFGELEVCFSGLSTIQPSDNRLTHAQALAKATLELIEALRREEVSLYLDFVASRSKGLD